MFLTNISIKRPVFATVVIIALIAIGVISYMGLPLNSMPETDPPFVTATIVLPGASPETMESDVSKKIEDAVGQVSGTKHLRTNISESVSTTIIEFDLNKNADTALQEVRDKVSQLRSDLPDDIKEPIISKYDSTAKPIISIAVTGTAGIRELSKIAEDVVQKQLASVDGVGAVNIFGNQTREIKIQIDKDKMAGYNLTTPTIVSAFAANNLDVPSGNIQDADSKMTLRTDGRFSNIGDFENLTIANNNGQEIKVKDIATVTDGIKDIESFAYYKGQDAVSVDIIKQSGGNTVNVATAIKEKIAEIQKELPGGVKLEIISDNSVGIKSTVNSVIRTLLEGCVLAVIIIFLFLGELKVTGISAISLPTSIITTFALLKLQNFSLNLMTLVALTLAIGLLIDDAIVVIENIMRHMNMGKTAMQAAKDGTGEIGIAVMATTFAVVAVFLPIAMVQGIIGRYLVQFGLTVVFSLLVSLFVSFTLIPAMTSRFVHIRTGNKRRGPVRFLLDGFNKGFNKLTELYGKLLGGVLSHRLITLVLVILLLIGSLSIFGKLKVDTVPAQDVGELSIAAVPDSFMTIEASAQKAKEMEAVIIKNREVQYTYTTVKSDGINIFAKLSDKQDRQVSDKEVASKLRKDLSGIAGVMLSINTNSGFSSAVKNVSYHIQGSDFTAVKSFAVRAKQIMNRIPGAADVDLSYKSGNPEVKLEVNQDRATDLGVNTGIVANTVRTLFNGDNVTKFENGTKSYDVLLSLMDSQRKDIDSLDGIFIPSAKGLIPLSQVTKKVFSTSASMINRYDREREIQISGNLEGITSNEFDKLFLTALDQNGGIPKGITLSVGGMAEQTSGSFEGLVIALIMGILFIFLVLAAQFESFADPLAILFSLPLAVIGAIWGLFISRNEVSMTSMIGVIMLMGLVTKNAILLIDYAKQRMAEGKKCREALILAGKIRLRPIMMTTIAMIVGMIPTAVSHEMGAEITAPMGSVIIGGLISSTLLTLLVVPIMYTLIHDFKGLFSKKETVNGLLEVS